MGYESKIIVVDRREHELPSGETWVYGDQIATFDLSKMGYERVNGKTFSEVFLNPIDFNLYIQPEDPNVTYTDEYFREDCYGEHCKWATTYDVLEWLDESEVLHDYRRAKLFYDFLVSLNEHKDDWGQLCIVHYGY